MHCAALAVDVEERRLHRAILFEDLAAIPVPEKDTAGFGLLSMDAHSRRTWVRSSRESTWFMSAPC